ncbi:MAG: hypothetical protein HJJLKODD_01612 [Phycisphaerae bacterium]|nr:hypothetical protein [Phycisphaerae bacterium]
MAQSEIDFSSSGKSSAVPAVRPPHAVADGPRAVLTVQPEISFLYRQIEPFLRGRVCLFDASQGELAAHLGAVEEVTIVQADAAAHWYALQRFGWQLNLRWVQQSWQDCPSRQVPAGAFDTVIVHRLLACETDDVAMLRTMRQLLAPGGQLLVVVSAGRGRPGWSERTRREVRRYRRSQLVEVFEQAQLVVTRSFYFDLAGLVRRWLFNRGGGRSRWWSPMVHLANGTTPLLHRLEEWLELPGGASLLMIGRRL